MSINVNDNFHLSAPKPVDSRYLTPALAPWIWDAAVNIPMGERYRGLTLLMAAGENIVPGEWWFKDGVANENLVPKDLGGVVVQEDFTEDGAPVYSPPDGQNYDLRIRVDGAPPFNFGMVVLPSVAQSRVGQHVWITHDQAIGELTILYFDTSSGTGTQHVARKGPVLAAETFGFAFIDSRWQPLGSGSGGGGVPPLVMTRPPDGSAVKPLVIVDCSGVQTASTASRIQLSTRNSQGTYTGAIDIPQGQLFPQNVATDLVAALYAANPALTSIKAYPSGYTIKVEAKDAGPDAQFTAGLSIVSGTIGPSVVKPLLKTVAGAVAVAPTVPAALGQEAIVNKEDVWEAVSVTPPLWQEITNSVFEAVGLISVATLEDLRNLPAPLILPSSVMVQNHTRKGDSGGGIFDWYPDFVGRVSDASILQAANGSVPPNHYAAAPIDIFDNNGTFVKLHSNPGGLKGRYVRRETGLNFTVMKPEWFGAFNTNSPNNVGPEHPESSTAIQAAYDALTISTFGCPPCPSGRYIRMGQIEIGNGYYKLMKTIWRSAYTTFAGKGVGSTAFYSGQDAFPGDPADPTTEKFMLNFEKPPGTADNDQFNVVTESMYFYGNAGSGNGGVTALYSPGAQGSYVRDIGVMGTSIRGVVARVLYGEVWIANVTRGPGYQCIGTPNAAHGVVDVEHVNMGGLYDYVYDPGGQYEDRTGLAVPAVLLENLNNPSFKMLGGEASPQECILYNVRGFSCERYPVNPGWPLGTKINGRYSRCIDIRGDSYGNNLDVGLTYQDGHAHTYNIWNDSGIARQQGRVGEYHGKGVRWSEYRYPSIICPTVPREQTLTEVTRHGIRWRNTYVNNYDRLQGAVVTITFVNAGTTSALSATRLGNDITFTVGRAGNTSITSIQQAIEELWAKGLDFAKTHEWSLVWATLAAGSTANDTFDPEDSDTITLQPSIHPNFDWRGMGEGETVFWPDLEGTGGRATVILSAPLRLSYAGDVEDSLKPVVSVTAVRSDGVTSTPAGILYKPASRGFWAAAEIDQVPTSIMTIRVFLSSSQCIGAGDINFGTSSAEGTLLARLKVTRSASFSASGMVQDFTIAGRPVGGDGITIMEKTREAYGIHVINPVTVAWSVPPATGGLELLIHASGSYGVTGRVSFNLEVL